MDSYQASIMRDFADKWRAAWRALIYEVVLTAFLMLVIMAVATDVRAVGAAAAIAIGGTVGLDALFGGRPTRAGGDSLTFDVMRVLGAAR